MEDQLLNIKVMCFEFHTFSNVVGGRGLIPQLADA